MRTLIIAVALLTGSCNTGTPTEPSAQLPMLTVTTDGGISGRGLGSVTIENSRITASDTRRSCDGVLTDVEREELAKLTHFAPQAAPPPNGADIVHYELSAGDLKASWYGEEPPPGPGPLFRALWKIRARVLANC